MAADSPKYGQLKGRILDNEKNPLPGRWLSLTATTVGGYGSRRLFSFANLSSGDHNLKVTYIGFLPVSKTIVVSEESTVDDIVMSDTSRELNEVVVTGVFSRAAKSHKYPEEQYQYNQCGVCRPDWQIPRLEYRRRSETYKRYQCAV